MRMVTALDAARRSPSFRDRDPVKADKPWTSFFSGRVRDLEDKLKEELAAAPNVRTTSADWRSCLDWQSHLMAGSYNIGESGTATATTATSLTNSGASFPTTNNGYKGHVIVASSDAGSIAYGVITNNTGTVITVDKWYVAATPSGAAATTPAATSKYMILPGQAPAWWITLGETSAGSAASDTSVPNEITTDGLGRSVWTTYAHTSGATSYSVSKVFTATGSHTVYRAALLNASSSGAMPFESDLSATAVMISGDTLTITVTVSI